MRSLKTLFKLLLGITVLGAFVAFVLVPAVYLYTMSNLPNPIDSAEDINRYLKQSIESERQSIELPRPVNERRPVDWPPPDFSKLPKHLIALYITTTGCPSYFQSPREEGWPWNRRLLAILRGQMLDGDGACELIFARNLARRMELKSDLQLAVGADRIHRFLRKDELVAYDLHSQWFDHGIIGVERASEELMQKPLTELTLSELAELQLAIPPWGFWEDILECRNEAQIRKSRDTLLIQLAEWGHISDEMARSAMTQPVRCHSVRR